MCSKVPSLCGLYSASSLLRTSPPERRASVVSLGHVMLPSPPWKGLGLRYLNSDEATLSSPKLRPDDSLPSFLMALSVSFIRVVSFNERDSSYGALTSTPMGLTPTEQTSLCWTHSMANSIITRPSVFGTALDNAASIHRNQTRQVKDGRQH